MLRQPTEARLQPPAVLKLQLHQVLPIFARAGSSFKSAATTGTGSFSTAAEQNTSGRDLSFRGGSSFFKYLNPSGAKLQQGVAAAAAAGGNGGLGPAKGLPWFVVAQVGRFWVRSATLSPEDAGVDLAWTLLLPVYDPTAVLTLAVFSLAGKQAETPVMLGKVNGNSACQAGVTNLVTASTASYAHICYQHPAH